MRVRKVERSSAARCRRRPAGAVRAPAPSAWRWLAAATVLLLQVFAVGHYAIFAHVRCAEHGELTHEAHEHGGSVEEKASRDGGDRTATDGAASVASHEGDRAGQGEAPDGHEDCGGTGLVPTLAAASPVALPMTLLEAFVVLGHGRPPSGTRAVAVLALAPKSSPPV